MKLSILIVLLAAGALTAAAQTPAKPASDAKPAAAATASAQTPAKPAVEVKPIPHLTPIAGIHKIIYKVDLTCQDRKIGTGATAEPKKLLKYYFTLWLAADGSQLDSTDDHRTPVLDKDKKPVLDENGKPKLGEPQPAQTIMGTGRPLPGWDLGFTGMKAGGKRRIFIPWQLGLGEREIPARDANHPAIPSKSDLILDVELVDVADAPPPPTRPTMAPHPAPGASPKMAPPGNPAAPATPTAPAKPATPVTPPASAVPPASATPPASAAPPAVAQPPSK
jgi:peptidylprolyl isomerase